MVTLKPQVGFAFPSALLTSLHLRGWNLALGEASPPLCQNPIAHPEVKRGEKKIALDFVSAFLELPLGSGGEEPGELDGEKKQVRDPGAEPGSALSRTVIGTYSWSCFSHL